MEKIDGERETYFHRPKAVLLMTCQPDKKAFQPTKPRFLGQTTQSFPPPQRWHSRTYYRVPYLSTSTGRFG